MGSKLMTPELLVLKFTHDFSLAQQAAVGVVDLGDIPENFVVQSVSVQEITAVTASTTIKVGPTASDAGFCVAADLPALAVTRGEGALVYNGTDKRPIEYIVAASQKLLVTTAVAAAVTGKIAIFVQGYQAF